ncbi:LysE family transporter [uncultured Flavobacterium sp.]|uniref:LysE family transporter n=1 Tax=uncultured Flavobacterium sp. TaxID=165435 RepID=UPI0030CA5AB7|tara:strand:+ start:1189 stop:1827 length:639 start_codon:yes stop_codon:yes gene_type:complete
MELFTTFISGFLIAALGILPPGMLNMTIAKISLKENRKEALWFSFGAVVVIFFQCFLGVFFAKFLDSNPVFNQNLKKVGTLIFIVLTFIFIFLGIKAKNKTHTKVAAKIKNKKNRFVFGFALSSLNMLAFPFYALISLTLASKNQFNFDVLHILIFSLAAALGTYSVFYMYAVLFKKIEHKVRFVTNNINFLIAAITGLVALGSLYNLFLAS